MKKGWETRPLGEASEVIAGQSPDGEFYNTEGKGVPFYQGKKDFGEKFLGKPKIWTTETPKLARGGDILMSVRAPVGPVNFATGDVCIGRGLAAIRCKPSLDREFLFHQLVHLQPKIGGKEGAVFASISRSEIETLSLVVPPLPEQHRIVRLLDEAFAGIAIAKANAEKNLRNARAVFESHLNEVFSKRGEGWVQKRLDHACEITMGQSPDGESYNTKGEGLPLINGPVEFSADPFGETVRSKFTTRPTKLCKKGDLVLCVRGSTTGRMNIAGFDACVGRGVAAIRAKEYQSWINHLINARRAEIYRLGTGATFPNVSGAQIGALKLPFPGIAEQETIVGCLDSLSAETRRLEAIYEKKLAALEELKKSLLHRAFAGEL